VADSCVKTGFARIKQCAACPWKKSTVPARDIPGGYNAEKHKRLAICDGQSAHIMACHETTGGREQACVGWLEWAIGVGNSIRMRLYAMQGAFNPNKFELDGEQYETLEEMLATAEPRRRKLKVLRKRRA
jgi:Family of unknown function (DUF6283)